MKKLLTIFLALLLFLPLTGFTSTNLTARVVANGAVQEVVEFGYTTEDFAALNTTASDMENYLSTVVAVNVKANLINVISQEAHSLFDDATSVLKQIGVSAETAISSQGGNLKFTVVYQTNAIWNSFCKNAISQTIKENTTSCFLKTYKTIMPIKLSSFNVNGQQVSLQTLLQNQVQAQMRNQFPFAENLFSQQFEYSFCTNQSRLHTNANSCGKDEYGFNCFTWQFNDAQTAQIEIWQVRANATTWYILALALTGGFAVVVWLISKKQPPKTQEN